MQPRSSLRLKFYFVQALTLVRVPLIFLFLAVSVFTGHPVSEFWFLVAFVAMMLSAVTDLFDGYFARKFQVTSQLGSYADPMTDKVFYLTTFPTLIYLADRIGQHGHARALLVLAILFLLRDQWVSFLRSLGALHNLSAKANWSGKARTLISFPTICVIYYYLQAPARWGVVIQGCRQSRKGGQQTCSNPPRRCVLREWMGNRGVGLGWKRLILEGKAKAMRAPLGTLACPGGNAEPPFRRSEGPTVGSGDWDCGYSCVASLAAIVLRRD